MDLRESVDPVLVFKTLLPKAIVIVYRKQNHYSQSFMRTFRTLFLVYAYYYYSFLAHLPVHCILM